MICISLGKSPLNNIKSILEKFNLIELRLDLMNLNMHQFLELMKYSNKLIITFRFNSSNYIDALKYYEIALQHNVKYIDLEIINFKYLTNILQLLPESTTKLIMSYHDFAKTPTDEHINSLYNQMKSCNADIYKFCFYAEKTDDVNRTLSLYKSIPRRQLIAFNLGNLGHLTRIFALKAGAPFVYAYFDGDSKTEKSQLSLSQINTYLDILNP